MASALQLAVSSIQLNDYSSRTLVDLGASRPLILLFFLVMILIAVGYDYGKQHMSVFLCIESTLTLSVLTFSDEVCIMFIGMIYRNVTGCGFLQIEYIWVSGHSPHHYIF